MTFPAKLTLHLAPHAEGNKIDSFGKNGKWEARQRLGSQRQIRKCSPSQDTPVRQGKRNSCLLEELKRSQDIDSKSENAGAPEGHALPEPLLGTPQALPTGKGKAREAKDLRS